MKELPILKHKKEIIDTVMSNQVTVIVGETGSGKTTQIPQFLYQPYSERLTGKIGITQPRRVAATSVAHFVAGQLGCKVGEKVGYKIRFDDSTTEGTFIKFLTDGMLLREMQVDPELRDYSIIMIDEAHERNLNMDFLLGLLKDLLGRRSDLKLVVSSATIEEEKFSRYFSGAPVINVSGRTYPVEVRHQDYGMLSMFISDIPEEVAEMVKKIHLSTTKGDILVFLTGEEDILNTAQKIEEYKLCNLICFPLYGSMNFQDQMKVFEKTKERKVVVATNIAETSVTIDGVVYVIDAGYVKQMNFHPDTGIRSLDIAKISKASAKQRTGRAGRTQPGTCYRFYSKIDFDGMDDYTVPEIKRTDLASVVLQMRMLGIEDVENFDFIDPPDKDLFRAAYETLVALGALDKDNGVTSIGKLMAALPLEPRIGRMVVAAQDYSCIDEVCTIAGFLSNIRSVFVRPREKQEEADIAHMKFRESTSDFLTLLNVYRAYEDAGRDSDWCYENFLNRKVLEEAVHIRAQLLEILEKTGMSVSPGDSEKVAKAVAAGLVQNICRHVDSYRYKKGDSIIFIHPSSSLFSGYPGWFVAADIVETRKMYARNCGQIKPEWIEEIAPHLCTKDYDYIWYDRDTDKVEAIENVYFNNHRISQRKVELEGQAVKKFQAEKVTEARKKEWIKLSFLPGNFSWVGTAVGVRYHLDSSSKRPIKGKTYYCSVQKEGVFSDYFYVNIEFEILNFN